jgi:hypothetical protein
VRKNPENAKRPTTGQRSWDIYGSALDFKLRIIEEDSLTPNTPREDLYPSTRFMFHDLIFFRQSCER